MIETSPPTTSPRFPILFVLGIARCGSTLLGRMLDMHPLVLSIGEMMHLDNSIEKGRPCSCGEPVPVCPFWKDFLPDIEAKTGFRFTRYSPPLYNKIRTSSNHGLIVDLSKTRIWRMMNRWPNALRWRNAGEGYIFLVRDSRGIAASSTRNGQDLDKFLRKYKKWMRRLHNFTRKREDRALIVHYEKLCRHPEEEMEKICKFLGIPFDRQVLFPADKIHHFVNSSRSGYMKGSNVIRLDERWRQELTPGEIARIESVMVKFPFLRDAYLET